MAGPDPSGAGRKRIMPEAYFRGAQLRRFVCKAEEGGVFLRCHFTADYTDTVMAHFAAQNWGPLPGWFNDGKAMKGALIGCTHFKLSPNGMAGNAIQVPCIDVGTFSVHRVKHAGGTTVELRFIVRVSSHGTAGLLQDYMATVADAVSELRVEYAQQAKLVGSTTSPDDDEDEDGEETPPPISSEVIGVDQAVAAGADVVAQPDGSLASFPGPGPVAVPGSGKRVKRKDLLDASKPAEGSVN